MKQRYQQFTNDDLQQEMFVKERVDSVLDNAGGLLLRRVVNGDCAVWVTTASCNKHGKHHQHQTTESSLTEIRFYIPLNTISNTFLAANNSV